MTKDYTLGIHTILKMVGMILPYAAIIILLVVLLMVFMSERAHTRHRRRY